MRRVRITLKDGLIDAEAQGFRGRGCEAAIDDILKNIGAREGDTVEKSPTPEYFETISEREQTRE